MGVAVSVGVAVGMGLDVGVGGVGLVTNATGGGWMGVEVGLGESPWSAQETRTQAAMATNGYAQDHLINGYSSSDGAGRIAPESRASPLPHRNIQCEDAPPAEAPLAQP